MRVRRTGWLVAAAAALAATRGARGMRVLEQYDLESLVYMSDAVVRGEVVEERAGPGDGGAAVMAVKVAASFKGGLKVGDKVMVPELGKYHHAPGMDGKDEGWAAVHAGDVVYVFLAAQESPEAGDRKLVSSGVRLVGGGFVYGVWQCGIEQMERPRREVAGEPTGDFAAMTEGVFPQLTVDKTEGFEGKLRKVVADEPLLRVFLQKKATAEDLPRMVEMFKGRAAVLKEQGVTRDRVGELVAQKLGTIAPPETLDKLREGAPFGTSVQLEYGLQTEAGRTYLLDRVEDIKATDAQRAEWARILETAALGGGPEGAESHFAERLAQAAIENAGTPVEEALFTGLSHCTRASADDRAAAVKILVEGYQQLGDRERYWICDALQGLDGKAFAALKPRPPMPLTLLEPGRDFAGALKQGKLSVKLSYRGAATAAPYVLVFMPADGGADAKGLLAPSGMAPHPGSFGYTSEVEALPASLPAGKYKVFAVQGGRGATDGFGFVVDIPAR